MSLPLHAQVQSFASCVADFQHQARAEKLPEWLVTNVVGQLQLEPRVLKYDRAQPEFTQTFADYFNKRVTPQRIQKARKLFAEHKDFLQQLTRKYGVPGQYIIAFWGLETNFGSYLGKMPTLNALATLACDERRSDYFTAELMAALRVLNREKLTVEEMQGSWAGAMGHTQFMPSAYERYAIDGDGDGQINLWRSQKDALASAANFLKALGWKKEQRWGREVILPADFDYRLTGLKHSEVVSAWQQKGVTRTNGKALGNYDMPASILVPMGHTGPAFISYANFKVIMRWNNSESYALAVGHLADRTVGGGSLHASLQTKTPKLTPALVTELQLALKDRGFKVGKADGIIGSMTKRALKEFQTQQGLIADGYPDYSAFAALDIQLR
ncbi:lytic murein transglycosylase [Dasania sp. GY-19]|uniref:Lytic murein transglycosylase n=2 Tax=Dasania phycosphaerae TaxID=2950436 RepID=A0A9J6RRV6_9GAMM|nr:MULTISPECIES: lytic murein transglycosylase [Dasania]MCZ0867098.1 lytic murein transglycosylase [Dasania phycosphaerae]MCZ0870550.1 lytic murein transglycosylase [Dasania phycosphaerae]